MLNYDFTKCLSPLDFELLSKDLLEADLKVKLENFKEGKDKGIDLRHSPLRDPRMLLSIGDHLAASAQTIVQCKRYSRFTDLVRDLEQKELPKISLLSPSRYILTTSVQLSPQQSDQLKTILSPFVQSTSDIFGAERLNSLLSQHPEIERRHPKLWISSTGVLDSILHAGTHNVSKEEIERTLAAAKIYVSNPSFEKAISILHREKVCIISGQPGIGKTTLARMLLIDFYKREYEIIKIESDISEARELTYHGKPRFYYYDDFLGQTAKADKLNKNEDQKIIDFMMSVRKSKDSVFVLTTREYILNQAKLYYEKLDRENFNHRTCIIDLSVYSRRIKAQILYNHFHFSDLPASHIQSLVSSRGYLRIIDHPNYNPRLIEYLSNVAWLGSVDSDQYLSLFLANLDNPVQIWGHAFRNQLSDRARHLLYALTTMPIEPTHLDLNQAFTGLHNSQCERFAIARSGTDFNTALKELDGTFVATRTVQGRILIRFQNPSIRDFMQNLILKGEMLSVILSSLVFFEQARWFSETLEDQNPQVSLLELKSLSGEVMAALKRAIHAPSTLALVGPPSFQHFSTFDADLVCRLEIVAHANATFGNGNDNAWIDQQLSEYADELQKGGGSPYEAVNCIGRLYRLGHLDTDRAKLFLHALKSRILEETVDLDQFEALASLIAALPALFDRPELESIKVAYGEFAEQYCSDCGLTNPEELREEASRIGTVGNMLDIDTEFAQDVLRAAASEIEREEPSQWDEDYEGGGGASEACTDQELDSMFGTLNQ